MRYLTVTRAVEILANEGDKLVFVFKTDTLTRNKYEQMQGIPCIMKLNDEEYKYPEIVDMVDEPFMVQFKTAELPKGKFTVLVIDCKLKTSDKYDYYPTSIHPLAKASFAKATEAQKLVENQEERKLIGDPYEI